MKTTTIMVLINVFFFLLVISFSPFMSSEVFTKFFVENVALTPVTFPEHPWTLLTSMFMHAPGYPLGLFSAHLFVNMLSLFFLGNFLERIIGKKRFLLLYIAGGLAGGLLFLLLASLSSDPRIISMSIFAPSEAVISAVGASAAIFALAGCLAIIIPRIPVLVFFFLPMKLWQAVVFLMIALSLLPGIANSAHLGGLLAGLFYGLYLKKKYKKKIAMLNKMMGFQ